MVTAVQVPSNAAAGGSGGSPRKPGKPLIKKSTARKSTGGMAPPGLVNAPRTSGSYCLSFT